ADPSAAEPPSQSPAQLVFRRDAGPETAEREGPHIVPLASPEDMPLHRRHGGLPPVRVLDGQIHPYDVKTVGRPRVRLRASHPAMPHRQLAGIALRAEPLVTGVQNPRP